MVGVAGRRRRRLLALPLWTLLLMLSGGPVRAGSESAPPAEVWLLVDGASRELRVMRGRELVQRFTGISVGRAGIGDKRRRGDDVTPSGEFRIAWVAPKSPFHRFFGIDFPDRASADRALAEGTISEATHAALAAALARGELPPQNTAVGGQIGIHGLGAADPLIHERYNWTQGCVALTNQQVDELSQWIALGTRLVIR